VLPNVENINMLLGAEMRAQRRKAVVIRMGQKTII
jgi:hypothetical protein